MYSVGEFIYSAKKGYVSILVSVLWLKKSEGPGQTAKAQSDRGIRGPLRSLGSFSHDLAHTNARHNERKGDYHKCGTTEALIRLCIVEYTKVWIWGEGFGFL